MEIMSSLFVFAVAVITTITVIGASDRRREWINFKLRYNKVYADAGEDDSRKAIWMENKKYIEGHNDLYTRGLSSFFLGENEYADLTPNDIFIRMMGKSKVVSAVLEKQGPGNNSLPGNVDWRTQGFVTPVKNQGQCGSCWAFSATGAMEGQHFKQTGRLVSLSESNLVDCSVTFGNEGCRGGWPDNAFNYVIRNKGIDSENDYPYFSKEERCQFERNGTGAVFINYNNIVPRGSELALQRASAEVGPISICIDAKHSSFSHYRGGIYDEPACNSTQVDHCVLLVGYGTDYSGTPYWLVKNSWGTSWGMDGYIMMRRNKSNQCGVASYASYPIA